MVVAKVKPIANEIGSFNKVGWKKQIEQKSAKFRLAVQRSNALPVGTVDDGEKLVKKCKFQPFLVENLANREPNAKRPKCQCLEETDKFFLTQKKYQRKIMPGALQPRGSGSLSLIRIAWAIMTWWKAMANQRQFLSGGYNPVENICQIGSFP